jgi:GAF domain
MSEERPKRRAKDKRTSDAPVDLTKEREAFVRTFLRKGVELTEDLLRENQVLQSELSRLQIENARLRAQVASDDAIRELLRTVDALEQEKRDLVSRSRELEQATHTHQGRYSEIEDELNDLANLYVASFQLHITLAPRRVLRHMKELLAQLVGAEAFVVYIVDPDGKHAQAVGSEGVPEDQLGPVQLGAGKVGEALATGIASMHTQKPLGRMTLDDPLAVIPLQADGRCVGAIAILSLLAQKTAWANVDQELFHLLGTHAATALIAASLYSRTSGPASSLGGLREQLHLT